MGGMHLLKDREKAGFRQEDNAFNKHPLGARHQGGKDNRPGLGWLKFSKRDLCMELTFYFK